MLVPPEDPVRLAEALRRVIADGALRDALSRTARAAGALLPGWLDTAERASRGLSEIL